MTRFSKKRGVQFFGEIFWGGSKFFLRAILEGVPKSRVKKFRQKIGPPVFLKIVSSQTNIRNAIFDQRSTRPPEVGVSRWHRQTDRHTDGHGNSMTNSAQWGRVGENALDGANRHTEPQTDGHGDSMTNSAQWGRVGEN